MSSTNNGMLLKYDADWTYTGVFAEGNATRAGAMVLIPAPGTAVGLCAMFAAAACRRRRR